MQKLGAPCLDLGSSPLARGTWGLLVQGTDAVTATRSNASEPSHAAFGTDGFWALGVLIMGLSCGQELPVPIGTHYAVPQQVGGQEWERCVSFWANSSELVVLTLSPPAVTTCGDI